MFFKDLKGTVQEEWEKFFSWFSIQESIVWETGVRIPSATRCKNTFLDLLNLDAHGCNDQFYLFLINMANEKLGMVQVVIF